MSYQPPLRGFTLLETLVACTLTVLLFGLLGTLLVPGMKATLRGTAQAELGEEAMVTLASLCADLQTTAASGVSLAQGAGFCRLAIHPLQGALSNGALEWGQRLVGYSYEGRTVVRKEWVAPGPPELEVLAGAPFQATPAQLLELASSPRPGRTPAFSVQSFSVSPPAQLITLSLRLTRPGTSGLPSQTVQVTRQVALRNRG